MQSIPNLYLKNRKKHLLLILLCLGILPFQAQSQQLQRDQYGAYRHPGLVLTIEGDTIRGKFRIATPMNRRKMIPTEKKYYFRADEGDRQVKKYTAKKLKYLEYTLADIGEKIILQSKRVEDGDRNKWEFIPLPRISGAASFYIDLEEETTRQKYGTTTDLVTRELIGIDGRIIYVTKRFFKSELPRLMRDCPALVAKFNTFGYEFSDIEKVILAYNDCVK